MKNKLLFLTALICISFQSVRASISIDSVTVSASRCAASGTIFAHVSGGVAPYVFELTAPSAVTRPPQSDSLFAGLPPGGYTLKVSDGVTNATASISIAGSYTTMVLNPIVTSPSCYNTTDGRIIGRRTAGTGRGPFSWELIAPSTMLAGPQASDTFLNLAPGNYVLRVTDSCGNFQTRSLTIDPTGGNQYVGINSAYWKKVGCDTFNLDFRITNITAFNYKPPYSYKYSTSNGVGDTVIVVNSLNPQSFLAGTFRHVGYNTIDTIRVTNACGVLVAAGVFSIDRRITARMVKIGCTWYAQVQKLPTAVVPTDIFLAPTTYYITRSVAPFDTLLTQVDDPTFTGLPNGTYTARLRDACGTTVTSNFTWSAPVRSLTVSVDKRSCNDSTARTVLVVVNGSYPTYFTVLSGPATWQSTKPHIGGTQAYTYPKQFTSQPGLATTAISNMGIGTYTIAIADTCGYRDTVSVTIGPANVVNKVYTFSYVKGCIGANKLAFTDNGTNNINPSGIYSVPGNALVASIPVSIEGVPTNLTFSNIPSGTYRLAMDYFNSWGSSLLSGANCTQLRDTITIPPYVNPAIQNSAVATCGADFTVAITADSNKGVRPYQFEVLSGPAGFVAPLQTNNVFHLPTSGVYKFRIVDSCGNSNTYTTSVDSLLVPNALIAGTGCLGSNTSYIMPSNSYYSYSWTKPNGTTYTGDTLTINPVTQADLGAYLIKIYADIGGCKDTAQLTRLSTECSPLPLSMDYFTGAAIQCKGHLEWAVAQANDIATFEVEQSMDGKQFIKVGTVPCTAADQSYTFVQDQLYPGKNFFRLSVINKSGSKSFARMIQLNNNCGAMPGNVTAYPNPAHGQVIISGIASGNTLILSDMTGKRLVTATVRATTHELDVSGMVPGLYCLQIFDGHTRTALIKVIIN